MPNMQILLQSFLVSSDKLRDKVPLPASIAVSAGLLRPAALRKDDVRIVYLGKHGNAQAAVLAASVRCELPAGDIGEPAFVTEAVRKTVDDLRSYRHPRRKEAEGYCSRHRSVERCPGTQHAAVKSR